MRSKPQSDDESMREPYSTLKHLVDWILNRADLSDEERTAFEELRTIVEKLGLGVHWEIRN